MNEKWKELIVTEIRVAVYVAPNNGKHIHKNRPRHGLVLNDSESEKDYIFDDGRILHTCPRDVFYLPKGSSYYVKQRKIGGCYAINFDGEISDTPFIFKPQNPDNLKKLYKRACQEWHSGAVTKTASVMTALYETVSAMLREGAARSASTTAYRVIDPAVREIDERISDPTLSVSSLATLCGVSEVYLRRLFSRRFGLSPKEYIIKKRMDYAVSLLSSGQLEVQTVGELCGYVDPCHFSREFSRIVGASPSAYLNK